MKLGRPPIRAGAALTAAAPGVLKPLPRDLMQSLLKSVDPKYHHLVHALRRRGSWGEGTCFFHSLLAELNWKGYNAKSEREQKVLAYKFRCGLGNFITIKELEKELVNSRMTLDDLPENPEELENKLCNPKVWADEILIRTMSRVFHASLIFWDATSNKFYCGVHGTDPTHQCVFLIMWIDHSHFEAVVLTDARGRMLKQHPGKFEPGHPLHTGLMHVYKTMCRVQMPKPSYVPDIMCNNQNYCSITRVKKLEAGFRDIQQRYARYKVRKGALPLPQPKRRVGRRRNVGRRLRGGGGGSSSDDDDDEKAVVLEPKGAPEALVMPKHIGIRFHGYSTDDTAFVLDTLNNTRQGWGKYGLRFHDFEAAAHGQSQPHIDLYLKTPAQLKALFPGEDMSKWSVTQGDVYPVRIYMNTDNWNNGNKTSGHKSLDAYRHYVINHEFGHAFGYSHDHGTASRKRACIMQQQTWGTGGGAPTEWPDDMPDCFRVLWDGVPHVLGKRQ